MACNRWVPRLVLLLYACGTEGATEPPLTSLADLAGTWQVSHWVYSLATDPSTTADWVAIAGLSGSLVIAANGDFSATPRLPGGFGHDQGSLTLQGDSLYWDGEDDEEWVHFTHVGQTLTPVLAGGRVRRHGSQR